MHERLEALKPLLKAGEFEKASEALKAYLAEFPDDHDGKLIEKLLSQLKEDKRTDKQINHEMQTVNAEFGDSVLPDRDIKVSTSDNEDTDNPPKNALTQEAYEKTIDHLTKEFVHDRGGIVRFENIPEEVIERLKHRNQHERNTKFILSGHADYSNLAYFAFAMFCIPFSLLHVARRLLPEYPALATGIPILWPISFACLEAWLRVNWLKKHRPFLPEKFITPMYLVEITFHAICFYPLALIDKIKTVHNYIDGGFTNYYQGTTFTIALKNGTNFFKKTFLLKEESDMMTELLNDLQKEVLFRISTKDTQWLTDADDFKCLYNNPQQLNSILEEYKPIDTQFGTIIILSNILLGFILFVILQFILKKTI